MDENKETTEIVAEDLPLVHQGARFMFSTAVGFGASQLADKAYDAALRAFRARRSAK